MKNYFGKNYQDDIISKYDISDTSSYLYEIASIQNLLFSNFEKSCILVGCEVSINGKTNTNLEFKIDPGILLINNQICEIQSQVLIDTDNQLSSQINGIFITINRFPSEIRFCCFLIDNDHIWNTDDVIFSDREFVIGYYKLVHDRDCYRAYSNRFTNNYENLPAFGFSENTENSNYQEYPVRQTIKPHIKILNNLNSYLIDNNIQKDSISKMIIPDLDTHLNHKERISRHISIFDGFYNDYYC